MNTKHKCSHYNIFKKYFFIFVISIFFSILFLIFFYSSRYNINPILVTKIFFRKAILEILKFGYNFYDPWDNNRKIAILRPSDNVNNIDHFFICSAQELETIIKVKKLPWSIVKFYNYNAYLSKYKFFYAPYDLSRIRKAYAFLNNLSKIANIQNDFQRAVSLRNYVKSLWQHGTSGSDVFDPQNFDALKIINFARQGKKFWCQVYALVYTELANYVGLIARLVMLSNNGYHLDHGVVEVWSNYYGKWILMDPDFNIHYELKGIPLNAIELHFLWAQKKWNLVQVKKGFPRPVGYDVETRSKYKLLDLYTYVRIDLRNDYYWNFFPKGHPSVSDENTLLWYDSMFPSILSFEKKTNKHFDFYWSLNFVQIKIDPYTIFPDKIVLFFDTQTPWFHYFLLIVDNNSQLRFNYSFYEWHLHNGLNQLKVCPINKFGHKGICSELVIRVIDKCT